MAKNEKQGTDATREAKSIAGYLTNFRPTNVNIEGQEDIDNGPLYTLDGKPRNYFRAVPGNTLWGYYQGTDIVVMPKYGEPQTKEERGFLVFEVAEPMGYPKKEIANDVTGEVTPNPAYKPFGVIARPPRAKEDIIVPVGEVVYVGVRTRIAQLVMMSGLAIQPLVYLECTGEEETSTKRRLKSFAAMVYGSERKSMRKLLQEEPDSAFAVFAKQDRGLEAAVRLYGIQVPRAMLESHDLGHLISQGAAPISLPANAAPASGALALPAGASAESKSA